MRACLVLVCLLSACAAPPRQATAPSPLTVIDQYHAALNRRDLLVLTAYVTPDVAWYSVVDGERIQEVAGREALLTLLRSYFAQNQETHWKVEHSAVADRWVAVRERSHWSASEPSASEPSASEPSGERASLVVYEVRDGRIASITHFL